MDLIVGEELWASLMFLLVIGIQETGTKMLILWLLLQLEQ